MMVLDFGICIRLTTVVLDLVRPVGVQIEILSLKGFQRSIWGWPERRRAGKEPGKGPGPGPGKAAAYPPTPRRGYTKEEKNEKKTEKKTD